jgi:hypothetical protein
MIGAFDAGGGPGFATDFSRFCTGELGRDTVAMGHAASIGVGAPALDEVRVLISWPRRRADVAEYR